MTLSDEVLFLARVALAAIAGAAIGLEREVHSHPAGIRTHLMVSAGAASFTILSMHGFSDVIGQPDVTLDPSRVAAQIVSGIGFIGGGAILKYGPSIRGLTTAGSLWATAAVGFAFGSGLLLFGTGIAALILFSLWPLNALVNRMRASGTRRRLSVAIVRLETLSEVYSALREAGIQVLGIESQRVGKGRYEVSLELDVPPSVNLVDLEMELAKSGNIEVLDQVETAY